MPRTSPYLVQLSLGERQELSRIARCYTLPYFLVIRAQMILWAADGMRNDLIALRLNTRREVVSVWRKRFATTDSTEIARRKNPLARLRCLYDLPRTGRPHGLSGESIPTSPLLSAGP